MKKPAVKIMLAASLTLSAFGTQAVFAQPSKEVHSQPYKVFDQKIIKQINADYMYNNIDYLAKTPRVAGTESEYNAVQYIKSQFESYGYEVELQEFSFLGYTPPSSIELSADGYEGELKPSAFTYSVSGDITGELVLAGLGKKDELADKDLSGKVALIQRGEISFGEKVLNAAAAGAEGVIIYNNADGELNGTLGEANDEYVPAVALTKAEGEALATHVADQSVSVSLKVTGADTSERTSHNVIATKKPTNKRKATDDVIVIGAHHDSVELAPGANDDASGTAMTLELARVFKDVPTDTEIRFVTFGAEELGLIGSNHYVDQLSDEERKRIIANFNLDMVGSKDAGDLVMMTADGKPNLVTELAQASSKRLNGEPTPYEQGGRSDHVPFAEAGIPAALFIHSPTEPGYHTPEDSIDKISKEKLQDVAEIVGAAVYDQAKFDHMGPKFKKDRKEHKEPKGKKGKVPHHHHKKDLK
ncbi:aminopeptidase YwaD [Bacillus ectoiniformans]|uniref:M20/M25/M40 family metallo-hydrolase n=1 Tax=Bacillus ectoiniformans TaxID=1494429 RepID=UPI00195B04D4|nr:M20/M25/M40 family metallo-hydrolase [Bacillus ectoiniformans]MBM7649891.1 aminopeptidase YwaD [Bacillus ectoiniformans]